MMAAGRDGRGGLREDDHSARRSSDADRTGAMVIRSGFVFKVYHNRITVRTGLRPTPTVVAHPLAGVVDVRRHGAYELRLGFINGTKVSYRLAQWAKWARGSSAELL